MKTKHLLISFMGIVAAAMIAFAVLPGSASTRLTRPTGETLEKTPKIAMAYMVDRFEQLPDPNMYTHLIYASGMFNDSLDGVWIRFPEKLKGMVGLKQQNPDLKVILCLSDFRKAGFCEMTADKKKRKAYVKDVKRIVDEYGLDGVDLDWEFPTTPNGGHTASPDDDRNYVKLAKDLRKALGKEKWISYFSHFNGNWIDHKKMGPYVDYVNVGGYNLSSPHDGKVLHHSPLYTGKHTGDWSVARAMEHHIDLGIPKGKLLMGIPFYGIGLPPFERETPCSDFNKHAEGLHLAWDNESQAPYYEDKEGNMIIGFDDERSIAAKFDFIRANGLPGVFVWHFDGDFPGHRLGKTIERLRK